MQWQFAHSFEDCQIHEPSSHLSSEQPRQILIDTKMVRVTADVYLDMHDYYRDPTIRPDAEALAKMQEFQIKAGFQKKSADIKALVDLSYLPN